MFRRVARLLIDASDASTPSGRAIIEERYWSLRRQVPVVYLLGTINLAGMELATGGKLHVGLNLPTFITTCGLIRMAQWFSAKGRKPDHAAMARRLTQTAWVAIAVCLLVCTRSIQLLQTGDSASHMAVLLFGGLTAIGVSYGLTALPVAGRIPLLLIAIPLAGTAILSNDSQFIWAALSLSVVAALMLRLLTVHNRHFVDVIISRSSIAREQEMARDAHNDAVIAATTDFLTGLPNRRAFIATLEAALEANGPESSFAVGILDLDRFKGINDTFGHATGDDLLREVAYRLRPVIHNGALVARLGGDEFGIFFPDIHRERDARLIGVEILQRLNRPATIEGRHIEVSACCGFGISRVGDDRTPSRVLADADLALYQAKANAAGVAVFEKRMEAPRRRRADIERALQEPHVEQHIRLVYQPIFDFGTGRVIAHEALARWTDKKLGEVSPAEFVPLAEQLNVIGGISAHLMRKAFLEAAQWDGDIKLSFNLSAIQLCSPGSAKQILQALKEAGLPAVRLQVEVTETALLADFDRAKRNLAELRSKGVSIILDDFGAGYASIGYLRELRFDQIKLDGALVTAAQHSSDGEQLLRAVVSLCDILGVATVAEHVENHELSRILTKMGCTAGQGFWLHHPVEAGGLAQVSRFIPVETNGELRNDRRAA